MLEELKLKRPLTVGEKKIETVSLKGLDALTGGDLIFCRLEVLKKSGQPVIYGFLDDGYRLEVAAKVSGLDAEVLKKLWAPDYEALDQEVKSFLIGTGSEELPIP